MPTSKYLDLAGVLNQLAGTTATPLDPCGAANVWAGLPRDNGLDLLGALNYKNGTWANSEQRLEFNTVCNELAGLSGNRVLEGVAALNYILGNAS